MAETSSNNGGTDEVLVEESASVRTFILNRPKQLNALTYQMVSRLWELFHASEEDSNVKMIILKRIKRKRQVVSFACKSLELQQKKIENELKKLIWGNGRAFCAGADVTAIVHNVRQGNWKLGADNFRKVYPLIYVTATYSKPQVSILNGIVMGGGLGASVHGRFRVATEKSVLHLLENVCAMPETALGLFPDAGEYAGLTGARLDGAEMLACGLATHFVLESLISANIDHVSHIFGIYFGPNVVLDKGFRSAQANQVCSESGFVSPILQWLLDEFVGSSFSHWLTYMLYCGYLGGRRPFLMVATLEQALAEGNTSDPDVISAIISRFSNMPKLKAESPYHKMKIIDRCFSRRTIEGSISSLIRRRLQGVGSCLIREYRMWEPSRLELITDDDVERYFCKIDDEDWEDLKLPPRSNLLYIQYLALKLTLAILYSMLPSVH
ncbi:3-hydroxyisobutyryl-CoA hydrolase 1 [Datura stramonium]|uniref:3-hydroxyisobutyryl-CoA hydrolase n=1 Tax=Datura stramonium TaxID=4076 RepID=A0ABS8T9R2_DATST|nr:3-hydroxyisobutyryl-CoA hydrolase 1 [Datura stramonium]